MSTTNTPQLAMAKPDVGTENNSWGGILNTLFDALDAILGKRTTVSVAGGDVTLSAAQYRSAVIEATGSPGTARNIVLPAVAHIWTVFNNTGDGSTVTFKTSGGTGVAVDAGQHAMVYSDGTNVVLATEPERIGSVKPFIGSLPTGWLYINGDTLGNASSGANQADDDYFTLYAAFWDNFADSQCPVSSGRGASAAADWAADKTITMVDLRGRVIAGLDDMGGSSADRLTNQSGGVDGDTPGAAGGGETHTLTLAQLAAHDHGGFTGSAGLHNHGGATVAAGNHQHSYVASTTYQNAGSSGAPIPNFSTSLSGQTSGLAGNHQHTINTEPAHVHAITSAGSGSPHNNVQPTLILPYIVKAK